MLDGMRRHKGWLKWSLALVCLAFVFLYVPGFVDQTALEGFPNDVVARVGDHDITVAQFRQMYLLQLENYRQQSSGEVSEEVLRSLGIDRQILQGMIARYAAVAEAERLGLTVGDAEVRHRIVNLPGFQVNGQFVGEARYRQALQFQRPPMTPAQFEEEVRRDIMFERLEAAVTGWIAVSDDEIAAEHRRRNEKVRVQVVAFRGDDYLEDIDAADEEIAALYEENPLAYEVPEKRQLRFLLVDESAIFESISPSDEEVQQYYDANVSQYTTPGQTRASHILLRIGGQVEAEVEARAAELAAEARAGADFAELAREHSEDEATAEDGGDLGLFGRGRMVAEVEAAAFDLDVDAVSDPVRSAIGFHVLQVTEKQEETRQPLEEVREAIENTLKNERATSRADALARAIAVEVETPEDLERAAGARGFELQESGFVGRGEPILGLGFAPQVSAEAFQMDQGEVVGADPDADRTGVHHRHRAAGSGHSAARRGARGCGARRPEPQGAGAGACGSRGSGREPARRRGLRGGRRGGRSDRRHERADHARRGLSGGRRQYCGRAGGVRAANRRRERHPGGGRRDAGRRAAGGA